MEDFKSYRIEDIKYLMTATENRTQRIIPFLGTGVSYTKEYCNHEAEFEHFNKNKIDAVLSDLGLRDKNASIFARLALEISFMLQQNANKRSINKKNRSGPIKLDHIPSTQELSQLFSQWVGSDFVSDYAYHLNNIFTKEDIIIELSDLLKLLSDLLSINNYSFYTSPLSTVTQLYQEKHARYMLRERLHDLLSSSSEQITIVHKKIAQKAYEHIELNRHVPNNHFLIISNNFDALMESALDYYNLQYAIITANTNQGYHNYGKINIRFSENVDDKEKLERRLSNVRPKDFFIDASKGPFILIYKIHGSINSSFVTSEDNLIITDNDFISFISRMSDISNGGIPGSINTEIQKKPILFLGQRFRDWNVRSVLIKVRENRQHIIDFAIVKGISDFEKNVLSKEYKVIVIDFDTFEFMEAV